MNDLLKSKVHVPSYRCDKNDVVLFSLKRNGKHCFTGTVMDRIGSNLVRVLSMDGKRFTIHINQVTIVSQMTCNTKAFRIAWNEAHHEKKRREEAEQRAERRRKYWISGLERKYSCKEAQEKHKPKSKVQKVEVSGMVFEYVKKGA